MDDNLLHAMAKAYGEWMGQKWEPMDEHELEADMDRMRAALHAISASGEWAVVPVEPTREMWAASGDAQVKHAGMFSLHHDAVTRMVWDALIQARPKVA